MTYVKVIRCNRCGKKCRNDGTTENPVWVCDNPKCVKYKPKEELPSEENE